MPNAADLGCMQMDQYLVSKLVFLKPVKGLFIPELVKEEKYEIMYHKIWMNNLFSRILWICIICIYSNM